jgi:hypothetical protein
MSFSSSVQINRIATLLASGLNSAQVSSIVNLSPSRISQVTATDEFKSLYAEKREESAKKDVEETAITAKYLSAEHALIDQVLTMAPSSELRDVTAALRVVAERQEKVAARKNPIHAATIVNNTSITLQLPAHAIPEIILNAEREVIAINDQTLAPLSSSAVTSLFTAMRASHDPNMKEYENEPTRISPPPEAAFVEIDDCEESKELVLSYHRV